MSDTDKIYEFEGEKANAYWDGRLCIHVGECTRAQGEIFKSGRQPWGQPDRVSGDEVAEVVRRCPTGALYVRRKDGGAEESAPTRNEAIIANNGPVYLSGDLDIEGAPSDMLAVRHRVALCRCGHSKLRPFCDNSHEGADFVDRGAVGEVGPGLETEGGPLVVKRVPDGPILVTGNLTIRASSGRAAWHGSKAAICRCGASQQKPFCDGSHSGIDFKAD